MENADVCGASLIRA
ncbi:hypothetical protein [Pseudomonas viridiflava]